MKQLLTILTIALLVAPALVAGDGDGGYAAPWLQVPIGARPTAMGGAYLAVSDDGAGPLFNPAGLASIRRPMISSSYRAMQLDRSLAYVTALSPIRGQATMGVHWLYAGSGKVEARDVDGYLQGYDMSIAANNFVILFAKQISPFVSFGVNMSYILIDMPELDANSVGFDFGAMLNLDQLVEREKRESMAVRDIKVGLTVKNLSKRFRWVSDKYVTKYTTGGASTEQTDDVPVEIGGGVSARFLQRRLLTAVDVIKSVDQGAALHAGAEYFVTPEFMLRSGYSDGSLTAGTGYLFQIGNNGLAIDYAFSSDKVGEGSEHIFSFDFLF
jgi:hypothetical protein